MLFQLCNIKHLSEINIHLSAQFVTLCSNCVIHHADYGCAARPVSVLVSVSVLVEATELFVIRIRVRVIAFCLCKKHNKYNFDPVL